MKAERFSFGKLSDGTEVTAARLTNASGASLTVIDYGAAILSLRMPDRDGKLVDAVLGYDTAEEYERNGFYFGATIGRVGNRIGGGRFALNGVNYALAKNDGENHLHGGGRGFNKRMWDMSADAQQGRIVCSRLSPDGEEGYPGNLNVTVTFTLTEDNALHIAYDAETDKDTPVNLTNHSYFNLNGGGDVLGHWLQVFAGRYCEGDEGCLPTGRLLSVEDTPFDFRDGKRIGQDIDAEHEQLRRAGGYDHNYCLSGRRAATLRSEATGIEMTVDTDMPGMQVYSGNFLKPHKGRNGAEIDRRGAVCLETQLYPNAMECYAFPNPVLRAGRHAHSETVYTFRVWK